MVKKYARVTMKMNRCSTHMHLGRHVARICVGVIDPEMIPEWVAATILRGKGEGTEIVQAQKIQLINF